MIVVDLQPETWDAADPMAELRVFAAWHVLRAVAPGWYPEFADWLLTNGVYSDAIREIWELTYPFEAGIYRLFDRALVELGVTPATRVEAVRLQTRRCIIALVSEPDSTRRLLRDLEELKRHAEGLFPPSTSIGSGLDIHRLIVILWDYEQCTPSFMESVGRVIHDEAEKRSTLGSLARREAAAWLKRHPEREM